MGEGDQNVMECRTPQDNIWGLCLCRQECLVWDRVKAGKRCKVTGNGRDKIV